MKRYLIINADDYGSCHAANAGIEQLFNDGFITSTTLMTPCPWAEDGVQRALCNPKMKVGLHITTTSEYSRYKWGPVHKGCPSLVDVKGYFYSTARENLAHATAEDMAKEIEAQYAWMESRGLIPEHIDSHMGTVYGIDGPNHLESVFRLCAAHNLNFRMPKIPETFIPRVDEAIKVLASRLIELASKLKIGLPNALLTDHDDLAPDDTYEIFKKRYLEIIESCPEGVSELFLHPCIETPELKAINSYWQKRVWEHRLLMDDEVLKFIQRQDIELCSYSTAPFYNGSI